MIRAWKEKYLAVTILMKLEDGVSPYSSAKSVVDKASGRKFGLVANILFEQIELKCARQHVE